MLKIWETIESLAAEKPYSKLCAIHSLPLTKASRMFSCMPGTGKRHTRVHTARLGHYAGRCLRCIATALEWS